MMTSPSLTRMFRNSGMERLFFVTWSVCPTPRAAPHNTAHHRGVGLLDSLGEQQWHGPVTEQATGAGGCGAGAAGQPDGEGGEAANEALHDPSPLAYQFEHGLLEGDLADLSVAQDLVKRGDAIRAFCMAIAVTVASGTVGG